MRPAGIPEMDFASSDICVSLGLSQTSFYALTSFGKGISLTFHLLAPVLTVDCHWSTALSVLPDAKITELMSIPDQRWTVHFTWSLGTAKLPTAPGGSLRKDGPGWEKAENKFTSGLPACVCVLCRLHICTCVFQCVVCAIKNLTKVLI